MIKIGLDAYFPVIELLRCEKEFGKYSPKCLILQLYPKFLNIDGKQLINIKLFIDENAKITFDDVLFQVCLQHGPKNIKFS